MARLRSTMGVMGKKHVFKDPNKFAAALMREAEQKLPLFLKEVQINVAFLWYQGIVLGTPVLTGRARTNWYVTTSAPSTNSTDPNQEVKTPGTWHNVQGEPLTGEEQARILGSLSILRAKPLGQTVYITNRLKYIQPLEDGHSGQAPAGMVELSRLAIGSASTMFRIQSEATAAVERVR